MRNAHIVVVADSDQGVALVARLRRMNVARVTAVRDHSEALAFCKRGEADACLVVESDLVPDAKPCPFCPAPGLSSGVPSVMMVPAVTAFQRRNARRAGYYAVVAANIGPRMLYRRLAAALQGRRPADRIKRRLSRRAGLPVLATMTGLDKPTLH